VKEPGSGAAVLIADDDPAIRLVLRHRLEADGHRVEEAIDSASALAALRSNQFDVALLDIIMPGNGGLDVLSAAHTEAVRTLIIVITAASTMNNAVEAMKRGAHDYLTKPFANLDLVAAAIKRAVEVGAQAADLNRLKDEVNRQLVGGEIIGRSSAMQEVYKLIGRVVTNDATVLLSGESGTGKEMALTVRRRQLLRYPARPARERAVRTRTRLVHRCVRAARRQVRDGRYRHDLPRRNRRPAGRAAA
jgi:two-component system nitrogen regulation response regulator GlnG